MSILYIRVKRASESKEKFIKREMRWKENKLRKKLGLWETEIGKKNRLTMYLDH